MWARGERDFEHTAELCSDILSHERAGTLSRPRDFHWARHVHTFTNQLRGTWADETRLCLLQARFRARAISFASPLLRPRLDALIAHVEAALDDVSAVQEAETQLLARWRAKGRPDLFGLLDLPEGFSRDPGQRD